MKVVIAPDSFKDAKRAAQAVRWIAAGLRSVVPSIEVDACPVADGGEGFVEAITFNRPNAKRHRSDTVDPLYRRIEDRPWVMLHDEQDEPHTAVIELAAASGLELLEPSKRNPMRTSTCGTGIMIEATVERGAKHVLLGIGGSATSEAGIGIAAALFVRLLDHKGRMFHKQMDARKMKKVVGILPGSLLADEGVSLTVACDVSNPLTGPNGAAHVYAPQKGATPEQVEQLDAGLRHMAQLWRDQLGVDVENMPGAGAAGGVGGGLVAMLGAELVPGAELVLDTIGFDERIKDADLVITGEGRLDSQSLSGKAAMSVAKRCQQADVPCVALVGSVGEGADQALEHGLTAYHVIGEGLPADESIRRTGELLEAAAVRLAQDRLMG
ncbi:MAG: glycerate kinase [Phycisphaeraceae bacterium]|nr:glycerate kinase [Phycisphaeraceae bacterium]